MLTSGTHHFGDSDFDTLLKTSFQLCGLLPSEIDGWKAKLALQSANLILSDWANRGDNLWLSETLVMPIVPGQQTYVLPKQVTYIKELLAVQLQEITGGTEGGGNYFPSDTRIVFDSEVCPRVARINPTTTGVASLSLQYGNPHVPYVNANNESLSPVLEAYYQDQPKLFISSGISGTRWRFANYDRTIETSISAWEITLFTQGTSRLLVPLSENDYYSIPLPQQQPASVSSYYLDRQIRPTISMWPIPDNTYDAFIMKCMTTAQDAGSLVNKGQVPQRFLRALVYEIATELSLQFAPDKYQILRMESDRLFDRAANEDRERVPLRITPNFMSYT